MQFLKRFRKREKYFAEIFKNPKNRRLFLFQKAREITSNYIRPENNIGIMIGGLEMFLFLFFRARNFCRSWVCVNAYMSKQRNSPSERFAPKCQGEYTQHAHNTQKKQQSRKKIDKSNDFFVRETASSSSLHTWTYIYIEWTIWCVWIMGVYIV